MADHMGVAIQGTTGSQGGPVAALSQDPQMDPPQDLVQTL